jgi:hypothetical protein
MTSWRVGRETFTAHLALSIAKEPRCTPMIQKDAVDASADVDDNEPVARVEKAMLDPT